MQIGVALGSNLGDRIAHMRAGRDFLLSLHTGPVHAAVSPLYETQPVGCAPGDPPFLNAIVEINCDMDLHSLLETLQKQEKLLGRKHGAIRNHPRTLDLDIIYAGEARITDGPLRLPHPRASVRRFVLQPLADIRPDIILPGLSTTVAQLLSQLPNEPDVRLWAQNW